MSTETPLAEQAWFKFCGYCGKDTDVYKNGSVLTVANDDGTRSRFHSDDCWPRARFDRTGEPFITCRECGKAEANRWVSEVASKLAEKSLCHTCNFWDEWVERAAAGDDCIVRVNGAHWHIGDENSRSSFRGCSGARWVIRFFDGREVVSTNLWHQGTIPDRFRERLPDNAAFVKAVVPERGALA